MPQSFSYLLYISRAIVPANSAAEAAIQLDSRIYNRGNGITGILHREDNWFAQYIEGTPTSVRAVFFRIRKDWRHTDIEVLDQGVREARRFSQFDMVFSSVREARFVDYQRAAGRCDAPGLETAHDLMAFLNERAG